MNGQERKKLRRIISIAEELIASSPKPQRGRPAGSSNGTEPTKRIRRSGKELVQFRKMLKAEQKRGVPVGELARKHGISPAYIYMIK
jgi:hypothetical protein